MNDNTKHRLLTRAVAASGAIAVGLMGLVAVGAPASAAEVPNLPKGPYSLDIHKYEQPNPGWDLPNDGTAQTVPSGAKPIGGVEFTVQKVTNIDLTTNAGWKATEGLKPGDIAPGDLGTARTLTTDRTGLATGSFAEMGVYLVTEAKAPANVVGKAAPFLVTLPFPHAGGWLTTLNVYPKNVVASDPHKTVDDSGATGLGDTVTWTVTATVPNLAPEQTVRSFTVSDTLDGRLAAPAAKDVAVTFAVKGVNVPLSANHYSVTVNGPKVVVAFTAAGRALLSTSDHQGGVVSVKIPTAVTGIGGDGDIPNSAIVEIDGTRMTTESVHTTWGSLLLKKVDRDDVSMTLAGAEFQVFRSAQDAAAGRNPVAVLVDGAERTTFTSGANGLVQIPGLKAATGGTTYWVVETKAPVGYDIDTAYQTGKAVTVIPGPAAPSAPVMVLDPKVPAFELPLTGGGGTAIFVGAGITLVLVAAGVALLVAGRRREASNR
ncbi:SpaH/EbpB family LPXTG-anchored major pilin [Microbacterium luticocti]|uniref:SpaH/EbpB family LPXTG-anchored major pilin n=1 Tax=Microbacterium luticocti TaxID=451764 RepID=UPI0003F95FB9|nr:SpaH/EbpB family LPXTG-anchored major pilin [Microbacterium luticocti]